MCYLVAKDFKKQGSIAFKTTHGKELASLTRTLTNETLHKDIQIVAISRPEAYGEYAPYTITENKIEFTEYVLSM